MVWGKNSENARYILLFLSIDVSIEEHCNMFLSSDSGNNFISLPREYMEHWKIHENSIQVFKKAIDI
ncbi:MAG: hypothetical protein BHW37_04970 [Firmicutes bacterium CAG:272_52_7]|nr:MAG: hypothetical protein BHW37_04970 [Firmicutes bacterium CAG:272_52_7]